ncbi:MAG TPA: pyridoxamine 5'-phosphate oxidase family protein [Methylomirabilota bacterium]|nr:pyridoxamine 5'-phosphate oxidase family protein [Methylomirabilota bacterium]
MDAYAPSARSKIRRLPKRAHYDHDTVHAVLDASLFCHIGYVIDGQPYVTPTGYWRVGSRLYWHGSSASRMLRAQSSGIPVCFTVTILDGLVLARSGFHHSVNYRSVMAFGKAAKIEDAEEKRAALNAYIDRFLPRRNAELRPINGQELKATTVLGMTIEDAVAKIRTGPPIDDEPDYALPVWAGVVPIRQVFGEPLADPRLKERTPVPLHIQTLAPGADFSEVMWRLAERQYASVE